MPLGSEAAVIELVRDSCRRDGCALSITANHDGGRHELTLDWRVPSGPAAVASEPPEPGLFVLGERNGGKWVIEAEEASATIWATSAAPSQPQLFILSAEMGFEHVKSSHAVLELTRDGWRNLWSRPDPQGPHTTAIALTTTPGHFVYLEAFYEPDDAQPDDLAAVELVYRGPGKALVEEAPGTPILALPIREFATAAEAKAARAQQCHAEALALSSARLEGVASARGVTLVELGLDARLLAAEAKRITRCTGHAVGEARALVAPPPVRGL